MLSLAVLSQAHAVSVTVEYELTALATPNRYEYRYTVTNDSLVTPVAWFSVDFDPALYAESTLQITSVGVADWSQQFLASVPGLPAQYDAYKTSGTPLAIGDSEAGFAVQFTWLGGAGGPGSQAFTVFDPSSLNVLDTGVTTLTGAPPPPPPIPEPSTWALMLVSLGAVALVGRRAKRDKASLAAAPHARALA